MGQKTNPNIFRLGINKKWKTEFFEKKKHELPLYVFKDLEIKSYIERFLDMHGILLHDYKQHHNNATLYLHISYLVMPDFFFKQKNIKTNKVMLLNHSQEKKFVIPGSTISQRSCNQAQHQVQPKFNDTSSINFYKIRNYLKTSFYKMSSSNEHVKISDRITTLRLEGVFSKLFEVLSLFTDQTLNLVITFSCLNKNSIFIKKTQRKNFILLQKFQRTLFLKEGLELMLNVISTKNSAHLLTRFIGNQIKKVKRHKFFFAFLKQTLTVLINSNSSKVRGIKISIKGRINGVPRAKSKRIVIGDIPVQSLNVSIDYSQLTVHNSNGSYGIKVWVVEKSN